MAIKSDAQRRAVAKYNAANYERIELRVEKGHKEEIKAHSEALGVSVNAFINRAICEAMERDTVSPAAPIEPPEAVVDRDIPQADQSGETAPPAAADLG